MLKKAFASFGDVRTVDIPMLDPYRHKVRHLLLVLLLTFGEACCWIFIVLNLLKLVALLPSSWLLFCNCYIWNGNLQLYCSTWCFRVFCTYLIQNSIITKIVYFYISFLKKKKLSYFCSCHFTFDSSFSDGDQWSENLQFRPGARFSGLRTVQGRYVNVSL